MVRMIRNESVSKKLRESDEMQFQKINVSTARTMYANGETVYLLPNKIRLGNAWIKPVGICKADSVNGSSNIDFQKQINAFMYYNCNKETGTTVAYYKAID